MIPDYASMFIKKYLAIQSANVSIGNNLRNDRTDREGAVGNVTGRAVFEVRAKLSCKGGTLLWSSQC
jgi:hypothetical protein